MKNRIKQFTFNESIEDILLQANEQVKHCFNELGEDETALAEGLNGGLKDGGNEVLRALVYRRTYGKQFLNKTMPPLEEYYAMLRSFGEAFSNMTADDTELKKNCLTCVKTTFCVDVSFLAGETRDFTDEQMKYREDFFNMRDALPKDNVFRKTFVTEYIDEEVYNRFYIPKEKELGRFDTDAEGEAYTPEGAKEWDKHFNDLCKEYGEEQYQRIYDDPREYYPYATPEDKLSDKNGSNFLEQVKAELKTFMGEEFLNRLESREDTPAS